MFAILLELMTVCENSRGKGTGARKEGSVKICGLEKQVASASFTLHSRNPKGVKDNTRAETHVL